MPKRIQMTRQRAWRYEHPDAVVVPRPSRWGNPYAVAGTTRDFDGVETAVNDRETAVALFRRLLQEASGDSTADAYFLATLAGRDLACWCPLDQHCHADVLLELANPTEVA